MRLTNELADSFGMPRSEMYEARSKYNVQKNGSRKRKIEWRFTFEEWITLWILSGKWELRGHHKGQYVMSRFHDVGPYSSNNVFIQPAEQNASDGNLGKKITNEQTQKRLDTHYRKSEEERLTIKRKMSESRKRYWDTLSINKPSNFIKDNS